jgi:hypothetical protein
MWPERRIFRGHVSVAEQILGERSFVKFVPMKLPLASTRSHSLSQWQMNGQKFQSLSFQLPESSSLIADPPNPTINDRSKKSCIGWW